MEEVFAQIDFFSIFHEYFIEASSFSAFIFFLSIFR